MWWTRPNPNHSTRSCSSSAKAFLMSSIISLDHEIVQLPDTVGMLWVYQTSQRNWVAIKVHYGYLRKCLLVGTNRDWDLSLRVTERYLWAHSIGHHHNELNVTKELITGWCVYGMSKSDLPVTRLNDILKYRRSNLGYVMYRLTKGIVYGIDWIPDIVVHPMRSLWNMWSQHGYPNPAVGY